MRPMWFSHFLWLCTHMRIIWDACSGQFSVYCVNNLKKRERKKWKWNHSTHAIESWAIPIKINILSSIFSSLTFWIKIERKIKTTLVYIHLKSYREKASGVKEKKNRKKKKLLSTHYFEVNRKNELLSPEAMYFIFLFVVARALIHRDEER